MEQLKFEVTDNDEIAIAPIRIDPVTGKEDEFEQDENFSYEGFQITREEFFSHSREPALTICRNLMYVNKVCIRKAPDVTHVLIMVNEAEKKILLKPCSEEAKNSIPWTTTKGSMRRIICRDVFCALISELTSWDLNNRYKMIGKMIRNNGERIFQFDMNSALIYPRKPVLDEGGKVIKESISRHPVYLESWRHQFGLPVEEYERTYAINRFDDYVVVSAQDSRTPRRHPKLNREETDHGTDKT